MALAKARFLTLAGCAAFFLGSALSVGAAEEKSAEQAETLKPELKEHTAGNVLFNRAASFNFKLERTDGGKETGCGSYIGNGAPGGPELIALNAADKKFIELKPFDPKQAWPVDVPLAGVVTFSPPPGKYTIYFTYGNTCEVEGKKIWTGKLTTNIVEIEVTKN